MVFKLVKLHLAADMLWEGRGRCLEQLRDICEDKKIAAFQTEEKVCFASSRAALILNIWSHCLLKHT